MYELRTAKGAGQGTPTDARLPLRANLKAGVTYYFECGGSGGAYTATLSRKDNVDDALYCDDMLKAPTDATALELGPADEFDHIYQYDGTVADCETTVASGGAVANVFEAAGNTRARSCAQFRPLPLAGRRSRRARISQWPIRTM